MHEDRRMGDAGTLTDVTHRDLKLENLLLARPNDISSVVIADFGLARNAVNARQVFSTQCGTPSYVAPEILLGGAVHVEILG